MKRISVSKKIIAILIIPCLILANIFSCFLLYLFEPISYNAPDLNKADFSFNLYSKYSYEKNPDLYIKQITANDIVSIDIDIRLKYIDDTILILFKDDTDSASATSLINSHQGRICGQIKSINLYQVEFDNTDYNSLINICSALKENKIVAATSIDYFEETPTSENSTSFVSDRDTDNKYYYDLINYPDDISSYISLSKNMTVGIFDTLIDSNSEYLNITNKNSYDNNWLSNELISSFNFHGTHVAGIFAADASSDAPGICPGANIISDNGINNSISYWIAAITDMITNYNTKVINMSLGYNSYIPVSASLECETTINYITNESIFFEAVLSQLINDGYEFIICIAAGNESGKSLNRTHDSYFSHAEKIILNKFDIFNIFTDEPEYCDATYSLPFNAISNKNVRDHIIVVGSCDQYCEYTNYSNAGDAVDIVAPGEMIYSLDINDDYIYSSGTSMASPFVAGTAALLFAIDNTLTATEVKNILITSATEYVHTNDFEYPLLNVQGAINQIS